MLYDPEHNFKHNISYQNRSNPFEVAKGLFTHQRFPGCKSPEITNAARSKKMGNKAAGPEAYYKAGKPAYELF